MKIWAHRGCSYKYPENTILAFAEALNYDIYGIETDIQMTKDNHIICIHDESLLRTTGTDAPVKDLTLSEIKEISDLIPTAEEVLDFLTDDMLSRGIMLNIELKTNKVRYDGIEKMIVGLVAERGLEDCVIYSSFNSDSVRAIKELVPSAKTAVLARRASKCLRLKEETGADDIHPSMISLDVPDLAELASGFSVRCWNDCVLDPNTQFISRETPERLFPDWGDYYVYDMDELESRGVTDYMTNVPEEYTDRMEVII